MTRDKEISDFMCALRRWVVGRNQNIYELMCEEWDIYEENWIRKMQSVGLVKQDLTEKEFNQLFEFLTHY